MLGMRIGAVAGLRLHVGVDECLQHRRVRTVGVIVVEREHSNPLLPGLGQMIQTELFRLRTALTMLTDMT